MPPRSLKPSISPRKTPRQERSAFTVRAILDAAARVLEVESLAGFNTNRVAEVAGVSVGSLYQYFPSKDALMAALIASEQESLACAVEQCVDACKGKSLQHSIQALVGIAIDHQWGNPVYAAALDHEEQRLPVMETLQAIQMRIVGAIAQLVQRHFPALPYPHRMQLAKDCVVICKAMTEAEPVNASKKALHARVVNVLVAALRAQSKTT
ncbi:MAG: TetR/AcrR family transcriptional regulator [Burkholderiaceae bacterium]